MTFDEVMGALHGASVLPVPVPEEPEAPTRATPFRTRGSVLRRDDFYLEGEIHLPLSCVHGARLRRENDPPLSFQRIKTEAPVGAGDARTGRGD